MFQFWAQDYILPNGITSSYLPLKAKLSPALCECACMRVYTCYWLHAAVALRDRLHQACFVNKPVSAGIFSPVCTGSAFPTSTEKPRSCEARFLLEIDRKFCLCL